MRVIAETLARRTYEILPRNASERMDQFSYYMIRIRHSPAEDPPEPLLAGIVERLGSGEKQNFADGTELLRLLSGWTDGLPNMRPVSGRGKT